MSPREDVRSKMVDGAMILLATRGVEGTSFKEILSVADAPRGSVYHHFPGGKSEILRAALERASERALESMESTRGQSAAEVLERFLALWRALLDYSGLTAGCAVVSVTVAGPDADFLDQVGSIFRTWIEQLAGLFVAGGMAESEARRMATMAIAATEGAVVLSRAQQNRDAFDEVAATLTQLVGGFS